MITKMIWEESLDIGKFMSKDNLLIAIFVSTLVSMITIPLDIVLAPFELITWLVFILIDFYKSI